MQFAVLSTGLVALAASAAFCQTAAESPTFVVASIKPAAPQEQGHIMVGMRGGPGTPDPGQITYTNVSLKNILVNAYGIKGYQLSGPKWLDNERFDIAAKIPAGTTKEQFKLMLQNLLAERFKLTVHHESKEMPIYALVVGKGGHKLRESAPEEPAPENPPPTPGADPAGPAIPRIKIGADGTPQLPPGIAKNGTMMMMTNGRMILTANRQNLAGLTDTLANQLGRPVIDATGLTAKYDFSLDFAAEGTTGHMGMLPPLPPSDSGPSGGASAGSDTSGPSLVTAIQEQLGLKLESRKGPVDYLVIDRIEKVPTEN